MFRALLIGCTAFAAGGLGLLAATAERPSAAGLREQLLAAPVTADLGGATTRVIASDDAYTFLATNAPAERQRPFAFGNRVFNTKWAQYPASTKSFDGLGPLFNRNSCSGCHVRDGRGKPPAPGEPMESMLVRLSVRGPDGKPMPHPAYGDQFNDNAILGVKPEGKLTIDEVPAVDGAYGDGTPYHLIRVEPRFSDLAYGPLDDTMMSPRVAPFVIGLGLLESVPASTLEALADPDDADGDGISGRVNRLTDYQGNPAIGRFGWKANVASIPEQGAGAALGDIGLTTSIYPHRNCQPAEADCAAALGEDTPELSDSFFERLVAYTRTLAVPQARGVDTPAFQKGLAAFRSMGCADCHLPTLTTGKDAPLPELASQTIHPFTDLLLHDMGEGLADHRPDGSATGTEWRTAPLWGIGMIPIANGHDRLLHDGRARGPAEAILWHGGEAEKAKEAFRTAPADERAALIAFLNSL
jgi:CxxC motif-containing protein (DUF1111 family)